MKGMSKCMQVVVMWMEECISIRLYQLDILHWSLK